MALFNATEQVCCTCGNWNGVKEWVSMVEAWFSLKGCPGQCSDDGTLRFPDDGCLRWQRDAENPGHTPYLGGISKTSTTT
jgi:hypothetical protein